MAQPPRILYALGMYDEVSLIRQDGIRWIKEESGPPHPSNVVVTKSKIAKAIVQWRYQLGKSPTALIKVRLQRDQIDNDRFCRTRGNGWWLLTDDIDEVQILSIEEIPS